MAVPRLARRSFDAGRIALPGFVMVMAIFVGLRLLAVYPWVDPMWDLHAYWTTRNGLDYAHAVPGQAGAYIYSPAFAQLIAPLVILPWPVFAALWTGIVAAPLAWLTGRRALLCLLLAPVTMSLGLGQLDTLFALVVVAGFRFPAAWAFIVVTKVTPGLGLLWFIVRREWRAVWLAGAATLAVVAMSMAIDGRAWWAWLEMILRSRPPGTPELTYIDVPLAARLPLAAALVAWGAHTDRRWTLPVGVVLAMPTIWFNSLAILVALVPLTRTGGASAAATWLAEPWLWTPLGPLVVPVPAWLRRRRRATASSS
jgi:hypothetical protein